MKKLKQDMVDMQGKECYKCHKGIFRERSIHDKWEGRITCPKCGLRIQRWKVRYTSE